MSFDSEILNEYCLRHSSEYTENHYELEKRIALQSHDPSQSSDFLQGRLLSLVSKLIQPKSVLEIGTYMGYATLALAEGLAPDGTLDTIEKNVSLKDQLNKIISASDKKGQINIHFGAALEVLKSLDCSSYDLVFIDAAKKEYLDYFEWLVSQSKSGTILIFDNVLWKGEVTHHQPKKISKYLNEFNQLILRDNRVENFILPLRDGLNIMSVK